MKQGLEHRHGTQHGHRHEDTPKIKKHKTSRHDTHTHTHTHTYMIYIKYDQHEKNIWSNMTIVFIYSFDNKS